MFFVAFGYIQSADNEIYAQTIEYLDLNDMEKGFREIPISDYKLFFVQPMLFKMDEEQLMIFGKDCSGKICLCELEILWEDVGKKSIPCLA